MKTQKSYIPKKVQRSWLEIDASANSLGRVATQIANALRGKNKRDFTPHLDLGDFVVAVNVDKLKLTGRKIEQYLYYRHTGYPGGVRTKKLKDLIVTKPEDVLRRAVFNMVDDFKLRKPMLRRLKFVAGTEHNYKIDKKI